MSVDVSWPLRCAVKAKITSDVGVLKIFDNRVCVQDGSGGEDLSLPAIYVGHTSSQAWHSATFDGQEHEITIHVVTQSHEEPHAQEIAAMIINTLHDTDLILPGHALVDMQFERSDISECEKRRQCHATVSFKTLTVSD